MNKRDAVFALLDPNQTPTYVPAAFFLHFDPQYHQGQAAVDKHMEYFRATNMDFVKIQFEHSFPVQPQIQRPEDWAKMPFYGLDYFEPSLKVVEGLVKAAKGEAPVILTVYSPFMLASHASQDKVTEHIKENPEQVEKGMQIITDSLMGFIKACIQLGLDGFYTSTQGREVGRFDDPRLFDQYIRPYDLAIMEEVNRACPFNILHICDYHLPYESLEPFLDYPGQVVNASLDLTTGPISAREVARMFGRPFMGGMERKGVLATGTPGQIRAAAERVLSEAPERFILGADCTVPSSTPWTNLRTAIDTAHAYREAR